ncbi:uncharacterized protein LOC143215287 [Lasioglossum baleicum]|uniref:uncharacterized protein LOC143215287 n=1 Tax=Lasioglossum baleicum TaxID=434251 RepID=UPI003FCD8307
MEDECIFQSNFVEKRLSTGLDGSVSDVSIPETEIHRMALKGSLELSSASEALTKTHSPEKKKEPASDSQEPTVEQTSDPALEEDNEDTWLSYFDSDTAFDVTCENLSYFNSTKAEKDSDSDLDDTLFFEDAEVCDTTCHNENRSCCESSYCEQFVDDVCESPENGSIAPEVSLVEIKNDESDPKINMKNPVKLEDTIEARTHQSCVENENSDGKEEDCSETDTGDQLEDSENQKHSETISGDPASSSDTDEDAKKLIYSLSNVNVSSYIEFRETIIEPEMEAKILNNRACLKDFGPEYKNLSPEIKDLDPEYKDLRPMIMDSCSEVEKCDSNEKEQSSEEYTEKLAEITKACYPETEEEVKEVLKKIAEEKAEIENRKNEALKNLSIEFSEVEKLVAEQKAFEEKSPSSGEVSSESDESLTEVDRHLEMPLTKDEVAESFKMKNILKDLVEEEQHRKELLQECIQIISTTENSENLEEQTEDKVEVKAEVDLEEEKSEVERIFTEIAKENVDRDPVKEDTKEVDVSETEKVVSNIVDDIIADTEDELFWRLCREPERTYIKGKQYDFDAKQHGVRMTEECILKHCKQNKLYQTPYLNDVLYLHYKGFSFIENLEKYVGLKSLWLENNGIREIANLENQSELRCLYLQNNLINKIENLEYQTRLDTLNLSHNTIRRIENLDSLKFLNSLNLSHNYLQQTADIEHLRLLERLSVLDLSHNRIDTEDVVNILGDMKELRVVYLMGNPVLKAIKLYRKTMILKCKNLKYLDDKPVFERDRACAEAWMRGGPDEEEAERRRWIQAEQKKINDSVQALINKRKLYKPVGTSEKEAEDKKKTKEDDEEEVAKLVCTSNQLLHLEKKKNESAVSSSSGSSASSSSDEEEVENGQEDDRTGQKRAEKSDGRRPMAEEEGKAIGAELLLPWRTEERSEKKNPTRTPAKLIEEITEVQEYTAGDAERKRTAKQILDGRRSLEDPPGGHALGRELAHYEKLVLETSNETEITAGSCANHPKRDDNKLHTESEHDHRDKKQFVATHETWTTESGEGKLFASSGVSCDRGCSDNEGKETSADNANAYKDISDDYRRKGDQHPLTSRLTSIREDMKEFCAGMEKFVEDNKIVYENGDVKGFWREEDARLAINIEDHDRQEEEQRSTVAKRDDDFRWWCTKERKLKITEIMRKREESRGTATEKEQQEEAQGTSSVRKIDIVDAAPEKDRNDVVPEKGQAEEKREGVYDLMNLKEYPKVLVEHVKPYPDDENESFVELKKEDKEGGVFNSLLNELELKDQRNAKRGLKSHSFHELLTIEESEEAVEETARVGGAIRRVSSTSIPSGSSKLESCQTLLKKEPVVEANNDLRTTNSIEDDESDNESVKTVIDLYDGSTNSNHKRETANSSKDDVSERFCEVSLASENSVKEDSDDKSNNQASNARKRIHDCECLNMVSKKSHLVEEVDSERVSGSRKSGREIAERCRRHAMKEAKKFLQKESPLIERCIESLINDRERYSWTFGNREDFFESTAAGLSSARSSSAKGSQEAAKIDSKKNRPQEVPSNVCDIQSMAQLLQQSETARSDSSTAKSEQDLYKDFCEHLEQLNDKRKLLIEPDFMKKPGIDDEEKKHDDESSRETKQARVKQTKPLIEVLSENPGNEDEISEPEHQVGEFEDLDMDPALKERILKSIKAPKSAEEIEKGKKSAEKLMKVSRDAMAAGKSVLKQSSNSKQVDGSRQFFRDLLKEDDDPEAKEGSENEKGDDREGKETSQDEAEKRILIEEINEQENGIADQENCGETRKSLEMRIAQRK